MTDQARPEGSDTGGALRTASALAAVVVVLFGSAFVYAYRQSVPRTTGLTISPSTQQTAAAGPYEGGASSEGGSSGGAGGPFIVHVAGAVKRTGVYRLPPGSRVVDAVEASGGVAQDADTDSLNLAAPVADGDQILVPTKTSESRAANDRTQAEPRAAGERAGGGKLTTPGEGTVNINAATAAELQRLPGIGPAMAARVLTHRKTIGRFTAIEQLLDVGGIGEKKLAQMKPFVRLR
ncbi:MAG: ComEA family DNA-binding protein [Armatimonadetes bacterium]|nr:ComEA family DNA-binding protein [Armatimonadota bacterium]